VTVDPEADHRISPAPFGGGWIVDGPIPADSVVQ